MKKALSLIIALLMIFSLFACAKKTSEGEIETNSKSGGTNIATDAVGDTSKIQEVIATEEDEVFPSDDATLKVAFNAEPLGLTQAGYAFGAAMRPAYIFAESLVDWDSDKNCIVPSLATEWEWVDDLTMRFKLRNDVTSIAGDPMTAKDVVFSFELGRDTASLAAYFNFFDYSKIKAIDDYTVELGLLNPYPFLLQDLTSRAYTIVVQKSFEKIGLEGAKDDPSAQTGPYKLVKWDIGQCVYAERRDDYWGRTPYYKYIEFWTVTDSATRTMGVEAGDYNVAFKPSIAAVTAADGKTLKGWLIPTAGRNCNFIMNSDKEPLNIKEVRQALTLSIDYESLLKVCYQGNGITSACSLWSPLNTELYSEPTDPSKNFIHYDLEAAKQKLIDAGYADGFTIDCVYRVSEQQTASQAEMMQNMFAAIGVTLELKMEDSATWMSDMRAGNFCTTLSVGGNPNAKRQINFVDSVRVDHNAATGNCGKNWMPDGFEDVVDRCLFTLDDAERRAAFVELNDILGEYVPMVLVYCPYDAELTSPEIAHFGLDFMGATNYLELYPADYLGK